MQLHKRIYTMVRCKMTNFGLPYLSCLVRCTV